MGLGSCSVDFAEQALDLLCRHPISAPTPILPSQRLLTNVKLVESLVVADQKAQS